MGYPSLYTSSLDLENAGVGDTFDVIDEDKDKEVLSNYRTISSTIEYQKENRIAVLDWFSTRRHDEVMRVPFDEEKVNTSTSFPDCLAFYMSKLPVMNTILTNRL